MKNEPKIVILNPPKISGVQRLSGNEQYWKRPEIILNQSWSALNVSETSTRAFLKISLKLSKVSFLSKSINTNAIFLIYKNVIGQRVSLQLSLDYNRPRWTEV